MYDLITIEQQEKWTAYVKEAVEKDFYHTWYYHSLEQSGVAFLFVYQEEENFIAFPLLRRNIEHSTFSDLTSVYGYTGPISNQKFETLDPLFMDRFKTIFLSFLEKEGIISVFSRLHPLFGQDTLLERFGGVYKNGKTVCIDLTIPIEAQRKKYRKATYKSIQKSWKQELNVSVAGKPSDIKAFQEIYSENMDRIGAKKYYRFTEQYFIDLLNAEDFDCILVMVYNGDEAICGSIITFSNDIVECHLMATRTSSLSTSPGKFLIDAISQIARERQMKHYHLGGGYGFKEDELFHWKSGFSDLRLNYKSWRFIADKQTYNSLIRDSGNEQQQGVDFFPLYRHSTT